MVQSSGPPKSNVSQPTKRHQRHHWSRCVSSRRTSRLVSSRWEVIPGTPKTWLVAENDTLWMRGPGTRQRLPFGQRHEMTVLSLGVAFETAKAKVCPIGTNF